MRDVLAAAGEHDGHRVQFRPPGQLARRSDSSRPANRGDQSAASANVAESTANSRSPVKPLILGMVRSTTVDRPASAASAAPSTGSSTPKTLLAPTAVAILSVVASSAEAWTSRP